MWIFTETGFLSTVANNDNPDVLTARARDRESLEALATIVGVDIVRSPNADYPYRAFVPSHDFSTWVSDQAKNISYGNFKAHMSRSRGPEFAHALHDVWAAMLQVEDTDARS